MMRLTIAGCRHQRRDHRAEHDGHAAHHRDDRAVPPIGGGTCDEADTWREAAQLGWTTLLVPEAAGGGSISDNGLADLLIVAAGGPAGGFGAVVPPWYGTKGVAVTARVGG